MPAALEHEADSVAHAVMRAPDQGARAGGESPRLAASSHPLLHSAGEPLDPATRRFMEPRFSHDFSRVRVHTGPAASASAQRLGAQAYTLGSHVTFEAGRYAPATADGRALLAHELAHVVQQRGVASPGLIQRKVNAVRFQDEPTLNEISEGKKVLKEPDRGEAVIRVTTALHELGHYPIDIIDASFAPVLTGAVERYQTAKGLKGKSLAGAVDKPTFTQLDSDFSALYGVERRVLAAQKSPDLLKHTQTIDPDERTAAARALSTEAKANPVSGRLPTFRPSIPAKGKYADRLKTVVDGIIVAQYDAMGKGKAAAHAGPTKLFAWPQIDKIAVESQAAVDAVFGEYTKAKAPAALKHGVNIMDAWDDKVSQLTAGGKAKEDESAAWRVEKILSGSKKVAALDAEHGAIQSRAAEQAIVNAVEAAMVAKYRTELIETDKGWPGYAGGGRIFIQRFKDADNDVNRGKMWELFRTFIHEYIHTLEDPAYKTYRSGIAEQKGGFALREGTTDYFTKIVWNGITITDAMRKTVEGPHHVAATKYAVPALNAYKESDNAERLAGIVGLRNLAAAFFLGKVELIGKK